MRTARSRRARPGCAIATGRARSPSCRARASRRHSHTVSANPRPVERPARQRLSHARGPQQRPQPPTRRAQHRVCSAPDVHCVPRSAALASRLRNSRTRAASRPARTATRVKPSANWRGRRAGRKPRGPSARARYPKYHSRTLRHAHVRLRLAHTASARSAC